MLRITSTRGPEGATLVVEGRLTGAWVDELARSWRALASTPDARSICVVLDGVTFIDAAGRLLLRRMHEEGGVVFAASGCMTREILAQITQRER